MSGKRRSNMDLPTRMYLNNGSYFYVAKSGAWYSLGQDLGSALARYEEHIAAAGLPRPQTLHVPVTIGFLDELHLASTRRARRKGIEFSITNEDVHGMFEANERRCALTDIRFSLSRAERKRLRLWAPSIDRIDPVGPYSSANCRLVCAAVNLMMNQFGPEVLVRLGRRIAAKARSDPSLSLRIANIFER